MLPIRVIKTKGRSRSVHVYRYQNSKRVIIKHIGSGTTDEQINASEEMARVFIADYTRQPYLFEEVKPNEEAVLVSQCEYIGIYYTYLYDVLRAMQHQIGYALAVDAMLNDLIVMRIVEPASKLRSIKLMDTYFGIKHLRQQYYQSARKWLDLKESIEKQTLILPKSNTVLIFPYCFMMLPLCILRLLRKMNSEKTDFQKTTNPSSRKSWGTDGYT